MKRIIALLAILVLSLTAAALLVWMPSWQVKADQDTCTLQSIRGPYAVVGHGTIFTQLPGFPPPPVLFAETGTVTFDGAGSFSGMVTASLNGSIVQPEVTGTYSVNTDCTTSITVSVPSAGLVIHEEGPIIGRGKEFHVIQTDPGWVRTLVAKRL